MQNRRFIAPKLHERPQVVSPLSGPPEEVKKETKAEETTETPVVEDKKNKDSTKKNN